MICVDFRALLVDFMRGQHRTLFRFELRLLPEVERQMKKDDGTTQRLENPLYHDTWLLLKKYRDVVWSLELSVQQVRRQFQIEFGSSIEDFLESIYLAGVDFCGYRYSGTRPKHRAQL